MKISVGKGVSVSEGKPAEHEVSAFRQRELPLVSFDGLPDDVINLLVHNIGEDTRGGAQTLAALAGTCKRCRRCTDDTKNWWLKVAAPTCKPTSRLPRKLNEMRHGNDNEQQQKNCSPTTETSLEALRDMDTRSGEAESSRERFTRRVSGTASTSSSFNPPEVSKARHLRSVSSHLDVEACTREMNAWRRAQSWSQAWGEGRARAFATRCAHLRGIWSSNNRRGVIILLTFTEDGLTAFRLPHPGHPRMGRVDVVRPLSLFDVVPESHGRLKVILQDTSHNSARGSATGQRNRLQQSPYTILSPWELDANNGLSGYDNLYLEFDESGNGNRIKIVCPAQSTTKRRPRFGQRLIVTTVKAVSCWPRGLLALSFGRLLSQTKEKGSREHSYDSDLDDKERRRKIVQLQGRSSLNESLIDGHGKIYAPLAVQFRVPVKKDLHNIGQREESPNKKLGNFIRSSDGGGLPSRMKIGSFILKQLKKVSKNLEKTKRPSLPNRCVRVFLGIGGNILACAATIGERLLINGALGLGFFLSTYHLSKLTRPIRNAIRVTKILPMYTQKLKRAPFALATINWEILKLMMQCSKLYQNGTSHQPIVPIFGIWLSLLQLCDELFCEAEVICPEGRWLCSMCDVVNGRRQMVWYGGKRAVAVLSCILPTPEPYTTSLEEYRSHLLTRHSLRNGVKYVPHRSLYGVRMWVLGHFDGVDAIRHLRILMADVISSTGLMLSIEGDQESVRGLVAVGTNSTEAGHQYFFVKRVETPDFLMDGPLEIDIENVNNDHANTGMTAVEREMLSQACRTVQAYVRQTAGEDEEENSHDDVATRAMLESMYKGEVRSRMCGRTPAMLLCFIEPDVVVLVSHRGAYGQAYVLTVFDRISWDTEASVIRGGRNAIAQVPDR